MAKSVNLEALRELYPDDKTGEQWFVEQRWGVPWMVMTVPRVEDRVLEVAFAL